jgi:hypothetical protein
MPGHARASGPDLGPDLRPDFSKDTGNSIVSAAFKFGSDGLTFSLTGAGVSIDPATGIFHIAPEALLRGMAVSVALDAAGDSALRFRIAPVGEAVPEPVPAPPAPVSPPSLSGSGVIGTAVAVDPGTWRDATSFAYLWRLDGAEIEGATGTEYQPAEADDRGALSCLVTATGPGGSTAAEAGPLGVTRRAPAVVAVPAEIALVRGTGTEIAAAAFFEGGGLSFAVSGAPADIDPATGLISLPADLPLGAAELTVTAANSGGSAAVALRVVVSPAGPEVLGGLADLVLVHGAAPAEVDAAAAFAGEGLSYEASGAGALVDAATGRVLVPAAALLRGARVTVVATNPEGGAAATGFGVEVVPAMGAPEPAEELADLELWQGSGTQTLSAQAGFSGAGLVYGLAAAPAGVSIRDGSGLVAIATDAPLAASTVTVRAANAAGALERSFSVRVRQTASVFDAAAALGDLVPLALGGEAGWTAGDGHARLVPPAGGRVHGDWAHAAGDGLYRCLARWEAADRAAIPRPFCLSARLTRSGDDVGGIRLEPHAAADGRRRLELRDYTGSGTASVELAGAEAAWEWGAWHWVELELEGAAVRGRIYPASAPAPAWQVEALTGQAGPGAVGPGGFAYDSQSPEIHVQRLEYRPPAADGGPQPLTATEQDWTLDQVTEQ